MFVFLGAFFGAPYCSIGTKRPKDVALGGERDLK